MSADNGIYILETRKGNETEYRVAGLQAVENVYWHFCSVHKRDHHFGNDGRPNCEECHTGECGDSKCHIQQARDMWRNSEVYLSEKEALAKAATELKAYPIVEYGISFIKIDEEF